MAEHGSAPLQRVVAAAQDAYADRLWALRMRLGALDSKMLTSPDGLRVEVSLDAIASLLRQSGGAA